MSLISLTIAGFIAAFLLLALAVVVALIPYKPQRIRGWLRRLGRRNSPPAGDQPRRREVDPN